MTADAEPCDFVLFQKSDDTVCAGNTHRVDRVSVVDLLERKAGMARVVAKDEGSAASRAISQLLGV